MARPPPGSASADPLKALATARTHPMITLHYVETTKNYNLSFNTNFDIHQDSSDREVKNTDSSASREFLWINDK